MRELNGTGLQVSILGTAPPLQDNEIARPALEQLVRHYLAADGATGNRFLSVRVGSGNFRLLRRFPRLRHILENHVRIVAGLRSGGYVMIEAGGSLATRILGLPAGFFAGMVGFLVAGLALLAVAREMRPLAPLSRQ